MLKFRGAAIACIVALIFSTGTAVAECDGSYVLLQNKFAQPSGWWLNRGISVGAGKMTIALVPNARNMFAEYQSKTLFNTDPRPTEICADFHMPSPPPEGVEARIVFWSIVDRRNTWDLYLWAITSVGQATLLRLNGKDWKTIYLDSVPAVKRGPNALNSLRVSAAHDGLSLFVNGSLIYTDRNLYPPTGSSHFGIAGMLMGQARAAATVEVTNFRVTMPTKPL